MLSLCTRNAVVLLLIVTFAAPGSMPALAQDAPAAPDDADTVGTTRTEVLHALKDIEHKYGMDAVMMEGHLLGEAVRNGSVTTAEISIPGYEERDGKRYLLFQVDTGIIYNDRDVAAEMRPARAWGDVVQGALKKFHTLSVPADGIGFRLQYSHKAYADEGELRTHLQEGHGQPEAAAFYLLNTDVTDMLIAHISPDQLAARAIVLVDGVPGRLQHAPAPTP